MAFNVVLATKELENNSYEYFKTKNVVNPKVFIQNLHDMLLRPKRGKKVIEKVKSLLKDHNEAMSSLHLNGGWSHKVLSKWVEW